MIDILHNLLYTVIYKHTYSFVKLSGETLQLVYLQNNLRRYVN